MSTNVANTDPIFQGQDEEALFLSIKTSKSYLGCLGGVEAVEQAPLRSTIKTWAHFLATFNTS